MAVLFFYRGTICSSVLMVGNCNNAKFLVVARHLIKQDPPPVFLTKSHTPIMFSVCAFNLMGNIWTDICISFSDMTRNMLVCEMEHCRCKNKSREWKVALKEHNHSERTVSSTDSANLSGFESEYYVMSVLFLNGGFLRRCNLLGGSLLCKRDLGWLCIMRSKG